MDRKFWFIAVLLLVGGVLMSACSGMIPVSGDPRVTQSAASLATQSAMQTEIAMLQTQVAQAVIETVVEGQEAAATPVPSTPTATPVPPTATPLPTQTPILPTATPTEPPLPCNAALFKGDISIPDGSVLAPGASFTKTWRLENAGACTWTTAYALVFVDGNRLSAPDQVFLPGSVLPGQVIDVSVPMIAPGDSGSYRGYWTLVDASGVRFGVGGKSDAFYVDIRVEQVVSSGPLDFVATYCQAEWTSGAGRLPCQGNGSDSRGYVRRIDSPTLETGYIDDEPVLMTHPQMISDGVIHGKYPSIRVENNYYFAAVIGCAYDSPACDVTFRLDYQTGSGDIHTLAAWREVYDDDFRLVEVDLNSLAGKDVRFILTVVANGASSQNRAQWLVPHISRRD